MDAAVPMLTLDTAQRDTSNIMQEIFSITTGFHGTLISAFARLNLDHVVDEVNDETLDPWAELQQAAGISQSTPLSPFMEKELLRDLHLSLDGSAFEKETSFTYVTLNLSNGRTRQRRPNMKPQIQARKAHKGRR